MDAIREALRVANPKYAENKRRGYSNWQTPAWIDGFEEAYGGLSIVRGATGLAWHIAKQNGELVEIQDRRRRMPEVSFDFQGELRDYQYRAVDAVLRKDFGVLQAPTGSGKTTMALAVIAARRQPTLIIVHTKELAEQWRDRAVQFLGLDPAEIGMIGGGKFRIGDRLTVALVQSLYGRAAEVAEHIGHLVIDEVHHAPSRTFTEAVSAFDSWYMLGLSATPYRRDGMTQMIGWYVGPIVHRIDQGVLVQQGSLVKAQVIPVETNFWTRTDASEYYSNLQDDCLSVPAQTRVDEGGDAHTG
jgi:superfamily II DNA or RNA helicase